MYDVPLYNPLHWFHLKCKFAWILTSVCSMACAYVCTRSRVVITSISSLSLHLSCFLFSLSVDRTSLFHRRATVTGNSVRVFFSTQFYLIVEQWNELCIEASIWWTLLKWTINVLHLQRKWTRPWVHIKRATHFTEWRTHQREKKRKKWNISG